MDDAVHDRVILGQALMRLRHRAGLLEDDLAGRLGIEVAYISEVESGALDTRWYTVMRFLRALDTSLGELAIEIEKHNRGNGRA
jgi:predicted transcriptional regulator